MDLGTVTLVVAVAFAGAGIVVGILIAKLLGGRDNRHTDTENIKEKVEGLSDRLLMLVEEINKKLEEIEADRIEELKREVGELINEVERLKETLHDLDVTENSIQAIEKASSALQELEFNLPQIDNSLLTQVKDNLLILRNDVENLLNRSKETKSSGLDQTLIETVLNSIDTAIELSKKLNTSLVKSELTVLANSLKSDDLASLVKELDVQSLDSKELVVLLEDVRKKLEGARNEASIRG